MKAVVPDKTRSVQGNLAAHLAELGRRLVRLARHLQIGRLTGRGDAQRSDSQAALKRKRRVFFELP